jgi:putative redox protein
MEMKVSFPGNLRVDAEFAGFTVHTDQPLSSGGDAGGPSPFQLFLASIGTCAGFYVLSFLKKRGIEEGAAVTLSSVSDPNTGMVTEVLIDVSLPAGFPEKYRDAVVRAVNQCTVKRHLAAPPVIAVRTAIAEG